MLKQSYQKQSSQQNLLFRMSFRVKNGTNAQRTRIQMNSVTNLLSHHRVPIPQENIQRRLISHSQGERRHVRANSTQLMSHQNKMLDTYKSHQQFRSTVIGELRKTSYPRVQQMHVRTVGRLQHPKKYQSQDMAKTWRQTTTSSKMWAPKILIPTHWNDKKQSQDFNHKDQTQLLQNQRKIPKEKFQFLKKGSNINRRVVTNLLKLKLIKDNNDQSEQRGLKKIRNSEIINLIKIYKGYGQDELQFLRSNLQKNRMLKDRKIGQQVIQEWHQDEREEQYIEEQDNMRRGNPLTNRHLIQHHTIEGWNQFNHNQSIYVQELQNQQ